MDGALDAQRARELRTHLDSCGACRQHARDLRDLRGALRALPRLTMPEEDLEAVWGRTVDAAARGPASRRRVAWPAGLAAAAALLLAALALPLLLEAPAPGRSAAERDMLRAASELKVALGIAGRSLDRARGAALREAMAGEVGRALEDAGEKAAGRALAGEVAPSLDRVPLLSPTPFAGSGGGA
jgi:hypothetical protein